MCWCAQKGKRERSLVVATVTLAALVEGGRVLVLVLALL